MTTRCRLIVAPSLPAWSRPSCHFSNWWLRRSTSGVSSVHPSPVLACSTRRLSSLLLILQMCTGLSRCSIYARSVFAVSALAVSRRSFFSLRGSNLLCLIRNGGDATLLRLGCGQPRYFPSMDVLALRASVRYFSWKLTMPVFETWVASQVSDPAECI